MKVKLSRIAKLASKKDGRVPTTFDPNYNKIKRPSSELQSQAYKRFKEFGKSDEFREIEKLNEKFARFIEGKLKKYGFKLIPEAQEISEIYFFTLTLIPEHADVNSGRP